MSDVDYVWEDEDTGLTVDFTIEARVVPYVPAKVSGPPEDCYPADGGYLEDVVPKVTRLRLDYGNHTYDITRGLGTELEEALVAGFLKEYEGSEKLQELLYDLFTEGWE